MSEKIIEQIQNIPAAQVSDAFMSIVGNGGTVSPQDGSPGNNGHEGHDGHGLHDDDGMMICSDPCVKVNDGVAPSNCDVGGAACANWRPLHPETNVSIINATTVEPGIAA